MQCMTEDRENIVFQVFFTFQTKLLMCCRLAHLVEQQGASGHLDLSQFVSLLHVEADFVALQVKLVSEKRLRRYQRKSYSNLQRRLSKLWADFESGDNNSHQLLCAFVGIYAPIWSFRTINICSVLIYILRVLIIFYSCQIHNKIYYDRVL